MVRVEEKVRDSGSRWTHPRRVVLSVIEKARGHLKPEEILARGKKAHPALGRATVYRTLDLLTKLGMIRPLYIGEDGPFYTKVEGGHHHMVCTGCGRVVEFDDCIACEMEKALSKRLGFQIESHLLEFYGKCRKCR